MNRRNIFPLSSSMTVLAYLASCILLATSASADTYYRWVDKDGSTKYTLTPPPKNSGKTIKKVIVDTTPVVSSNVATSNNAVPNSSNTDSQQPNPNAVVNAQNQIPNTGTLPNTSPNPNSAALNNTAPPASLTSPPAITTITPPPANRLIVPTQDQTRPVFENP